MNNEFTRKDQHNLAKAYTLVREDVTPPAPVPGAPTTGQGPANNIQQNIQQGISSELQTYFTQFGKKLAAANVKLDPNVIKTAMDTLNKAIQQSMAKNQAATKPQGGVAPTTPAPATPTTPPTA